MSLGIVLSCQRLTTERRPLASVACSMFPIWLARNRATLSSVCPVGMPHMGTLALAAGARFRALKSTGVRLSRAVSRSKLRREKSHSGFKRYFGKMNRKDYWFGKARTTKIGLSFWVGGFRLPIQGVAVPVSVADAVRTGRGRVHDCKRSSSQCAERMAQIGNGAVSASCSVAAVTA
jgi:hypothetical protein